MASKQAQHQIQMESWRLARDRIIIRVGVSGHENLLVVGVMLALYPKSGRAVFSFLVKNCSFLVMLSLQVRSNCPMPNAGSVLEGFILG